VMKYSLRVLSFCNKEVLGMRADLSHLLQDLHANSRFQTQSMSGNFNDSGKK